MAENTTPDAAAIEAAKKLASRMVERLIDDADFAYFVGLRSETRELLIAAAAKLFNLTADEVEAKIKEQRDFVQSYRPSEPRHVKAEAERDRLVEQILELLNRPSDDWHERLRAIADNGGRDG